MASCQLAVVIRGFSKTETEDLALDSKWYNSRLLGFEIEWSFKLGKSVLHTRSFRFNQMRFSLVAPDEKYAIPDRSIHS